MGSIGAMGVRWDFGVVAIAFALSACSSGSTASSGNDGGSGGTCADGFTPDVAGDGCVEVIPAADCPAGTRAALGSTTCAPIATFACPAGFIADASGWGCTDISPAAACPAGTIEELGSTTCAPIDDCSAAFPPANAALFVDAATTTADATHFKTIGAAITAATPGAVIAVESGTYVEAPETHIPLSVVGRCASQVKIRTPGGMLAGFQAINVTGKVAISGVSLTGFRGGVVEQSGDMTVTDCDIRSSQGAGIVAIGGALHVSHTRLSGSIEQSGVGFGAFLTNGANVDLDRVVAAENPIDGIATNSKSTVKISRSIITSNGPDAAGKAGAGLAVAEGSSASVDGSAFIKNHSTNVEAYDAGTTLKMTGSVVRDVLADNFHDHGDGIALDATASADITQTTVSGSAESGMIVVGTGTDAHVSSSVFLGGAGNVQRGIGVSGGASAELDGVVVVSPRDYGLLVQDSGSTMTVSGSLVRDEVRTVLSDSAAGDGVQVAFGATLTMSDSSIVDSAQLGIGAGGTGDTGAGGTVTLTKVIIFKSHANENGDFGRAIQATAGASITANGCAFLDSQETAIVLGVSATADIHDSVIRRSGTNGPTKYGYGAVVLSSAALSLESSSVRDNLGVGLAFDDSSGTIDNVVVAHNAIGIFASQATLNDVATPPSGMTPKQVFVSQTRFVDNATRVSSDDIPLPQVIQ